VLVQTQVSVKMMKSKECFASMHMLGHMTATLLTTSLGTSSWQLHHTVIYSLMLSSPLEGGTLRFTELSWQVQALTLSVCSALKCRKVRELTMQLPVLMLVWQASVVFGTPEAKASLLILAAPIYSGHNIACLSCAWVQHEGCSQVAIMRRSDAR